MYLLNALARWLPGLAVVSTGLSVAALEPEEVLSFKTGPLSLRPQFSLGESYSDNIFYEGTDEADDFITTLSPGLKLQLGRPDHNNLQLNYQYDHLLYADNSDLDTGQHTIDLKSAIAFERLRLEGMDRIQVLSSPLSGVVERIIDPSGNATFTRGNVDRLAIADTYTFSYDLSEKTAVYLRGEHSLLNYEENVALYDMQKLTGTGGFGFRVFPKTIVFGETYYGRTRTEVNDPSQVSNPRLDAIGGYVGVRGNFTPKLTGMAKVGYEHREFADDSPTPSDPVADLSIGYAFSPKRSLALTYSHQNFVSIQYSRQTYTADVVGVNFNQMLGSTGKWQATVGGSYSLYGYEQGGGVAESVDYDYIRASFSLAYKIQRWLTASCGYDFEKVMGETGQVIEYDVNRVNLRMTVGF
ncbi:MAG: outer membrane beta-barrel protein [Verrucomicrobiia bacterium]